MTAGSEIAAEITAALIEVAEATGDGPLYVCLEKAGAPGGTAGNPIVGARTLHTLTAMQDESMIVGLGGPVIGQAIKKLIVSAEGETPEKGDRVAVGYTKDDTIPDAAWLQIEDVATTAPGGVALMHEVVLES